MAIEKNKDTSIEEQKEKPVKEADALSDPKYICNSCTIITDALKKGCDVVQMPNGDIIIREQKIVTTKYIWDHDKEKIVKSSTRIEDSIAKE
ncbi:MAG: DUF2671 domain-containing protein [Rickettsiales bacterium]|nr:DUF2671 domain-containing protein [Rickettsiales bacterium]